MSSRLDSAGECISTPQHDGSAARALPPRLYVRLMHELHDGRPELHTATNSSGYRNKASFSLGKQFVGEQDGAQKRMRPAAGHRI